MKIQHTRINVWDAGGKNLSLNMVARLKFRIKDQKFIQTFIVIEKLGVKRFACVLGLDFCRKYGAITVCAQTETVTIKNSELGKNQKSMVENEREGEGVTAPLVRLKSKTFVNPHSHLCIMAELEAVDNMKEVEQHDFEIVPRKFLPIEVEPVIVKVLTHQGKLVVNVVLTNRSPRRITMRAGTTIAFLQQVEVVRNDIATSGRYIQEQIEAQGGPLSEDDVNEYLYALSRQSTIGRPSDTEYSLGRLQKWAEDNVKDNGAEPESPEPTAQQFLSQFTFGELTPDQARVIEALLIEYREIFASDDTRLGRTNLVEHQIIVEGGTAPIHRQPYKMEYRKKEILRKILRDLERNHIIRRSNSPWSSPCVLVRKNARDPTRDDNDHKSWRLCVDFRALNKVTLPENWSMPKIHELLDSLSGSSVFMSLDLAQGYHQIGVAQDSIKYTAFATHFGAWEYLATPFGLSNSSKSFMRLLDTVLQGLQCDCATYIDDILVHGSSFEQAVGRLRRVFNRLRSAGLKLQPKKCRFGLRQVRFLGFDVSAEGIKPARENVASILDYPKPRNLRALRKFLGGAAYFHRLVENFSLLASDLTELLKKGVKFHWGPAQQTAFDKIKSILATQPVVVPADFSRKFELRVDSSSKGAGACLLQEHAGQSRPVAYFSRKFSPTEKRYASAELEALGVALAVRNFKHYLFGAKFDLVTDNRSLKYLLSTTQPKSARLTRFAMELMEYDFQVRHIPGNDNALCDALSRAPVGETPEDGETEAHSPFCALVARSSDCKIEGPSRVLAQTNPAPVNQVPVRDDGGVGEFVNVLTKLQADEGQNDEKSERENRGMQSGRNELSRAVIIAEQRKDEYLRAIIDYLNGPHVTPEWPKKKLTAFLAEAELYAIKDKILVRADKRPRPQADHIDRIVIPESLVPQVLNLYHANPLSGHYGVGKCFAALKERVFFPRMYTRVSEFCADCIVCHKIKKGGTVAKVPMKIMPIPDGAFLKLHYDALGPYRVTDSGSKYIIGFICALSRYAILCPVSDIKAETVAKVLTYEVVLRYGRFETLVSDAASNFNSAVLNNVYKTLQISKLTTSPAHQASNGVIERLFRPIKAMLSATTANDPNWDLQVGFACYAYNTHRHRSHSQIPFELVFGRPPPNLIDFAIAPSRPTYRAGVDPLGYGDEIKLRIKEANERAKACLQQSQATQKANYDRKAKPHNVAPNDLVFKPSLKNKGDLGYAFDGPYKVVGTDENHVTVKKGGRTKRWNVTTVKKYRGKCKTHTLSDEEADAYVNNKQTGRQPSQSTHPMVLRDRARV